MTGQERPLNPQLNRLQLSVPGHWLSFEAMNPLVVVKRLPGWWHLKVFGKQSEFRICSSCVPVCRSHYQKSLDSFGEGMKRDYHWSMTHCCRSRSYFPEQNQRSPNWKSFLAGSVARHSKFEAMRIGSSSYESCANHSSRTGTATATWLRFCQLTHAKEPG